MAAILKLRRASSVPTLVESELFYNTSLTTLQVGKSSGVITLVKLNEVNTGNLQVVGTISGSALTLNGDITAQNAYFRGDVRLDGQIFLGDVPQDNINVNAQFSGSLIPSASTFDLGSETKKWNNIYANTINGNIVDSNLLHFTESINSFTSSQESKNNTVGLYTSSINDKFTTLGTYTGSVNSDLQLIHTFTSSQESKNSTLGTYTGSVDDKFTTLGTYTGSVDNQLIELYSTASNHEDRIVYLSGSFSQSVDDRLDQLEINSGSVNNSVSLLNTFTSSQESKNSTLGTYTGSVDDKFDTLATYTGSINDDLATIHSFTSSQESKNSTLGTYTGSINNQLTELFSTASDHEIRVDGIQDYTASLKTAIGVNGSNVTINGDLSVLGTTTQINSTQVNIGENIIELNYGGSANTAGIITKDATGGSTISGSLLWDSTNDYWKAGKLANESKILLAGGDSVVSGSAQISLVDSADYVSAIKNRLNIENVISSSIQVNVYNTTNFTSYSSSVDSRLITITNDGILQASRLTNLETFTSSQEVKNSTIATYTGSNDTKWDTLSSVTSSLINATSSYETKGRDIVSGSSQVTASLDGRYELQGRNLFSGSSQVTASLDGRYELQGRNIVSESSQLTSSYDLRYANSSSFSNLVGAWNYGTQGSIRDAAFYSVTSSADIVLASGSINYNNNHLLTAGATKKYIDWRTDEILTAIAVADITSVIAGNGLTGGGVTGDVTLSLDTSSANFTDGIKSKLNTDGVVSGSSQITIGSVTGFTAFSQSVDGRLDQLEAFTSSQETKNNTLGTYTASIDSHVSALNSFTSSIDTTIKTKLNVEGVISGSSQLNGTTINNLTTTASGSFTGSFTGSFRGTATSAGTVLTQNSNANQDYSLIFTTSGSNGYMQTYTDGVAVGSVLYNPSTNRLKSTYIQGEIEATNGVISGSSQITASFDGRYVQTGSFNTYTASQDTKNLSLQAFTASQEAKDLTIASYTASNDTKWSTLGSLSGSFARIDTPNTFNSTQTISGSLYVTQDLVVLGSSSIQNISSSNLVIGTAYVTLNTNTPSSRYAGLLMVDSGSAGSSGSFLYDAVDDEFVFVHKGNGTNVTSSHFVLGPETYDNLGNEIYITKDKLTKSFGNEHIVESNITDNGTLITLGSNTIVTGTLLATGTPLVSGSSQITLSSTTGGGTSANVQFGSLGIGMAASGTTGRIDATNDIVAYSSSDRRFKDNIKPIENALDKINQIGGYEFDWKDENKIEHGYEGHDLGVIAQEIEAIAPELVQTRENGYKAVKYDKLVSVLIQAVKELSAKVSELENK